MFRAHLAPVRLFPYACDVQVNGNVDQSAALSNANNIAQGRGSVACLDVATIGDLQPCDGYD